MAYIPETHEHTCAICKSEYVSHTSIDWGMCDNCETRAKHFIQEETHDWIPQDIWEGEYINQDTEYYLYDDLLDMFSKRFNTDAGEISDNCEDQLKEIMYNTVPR